MENIVKEFKNAMKKDDIARVVLLGCQLADENATLKETIQANHEFIDDLEQQIEKSESENASLRARLEKVVELPCGVGDMVLLLDLNIYHRCEVRIIPCIIDEFTTVRNGTYAVLNGRGYILP